MYAEKRVGPRIEPCGTPSTSISLYFYSPRCSWTSFTSKVLDLRWRASWQAAVTTLSIKSSAICSSIWEEDRWGTSGHKWWGFKTLHALVFALWFWDAIFSERHFWARKHTSSTSSSSCSLGSISLTRSCSFFLLNTWVEGKQVVRHSQWCTRSSQAEWLHAHCTPWNLASGKGDEYRRHVFTESTCTWNWRIGVNVCKAK